MSQGQHVPHSSTRFTSRKKWSITFLMVIIALITAIAVATLPRSQPTQASGPTLQVSPLGSPYSNRDDQPPIQVQGTGYQAGEQVQVYWDYTGPGTGKLEGTATTNPKGIFTFSFLRELAPAGTYTLAGIGQTSGDIATAPYKQFPQLYVRAQAGGPNSPVTVYGNAFGKGETVNVLWNYTGPGTGTPLVTATGDSTGSFSASATIPSGYAPGTYPIEGFGQTTKTKAKYSYIIYQPTFALAPLTGSAGTAVTLSAYGFTGLEPVDIFWNNGSMPVATIATSDYGYLAPTTFTIPANTPPGTYPLKVIGETSQLSITNTYTVVDPTTSFNTTSGPIGDKIQVSGQGYAPNEVVKILWNYKNGTGTRVANITAGFSGTLHGKFTVPTAPTGSYTVAAVGTASKSITTNTLTISNSIAVDPVKNSPGQGVTVTGTGFQPGEKVQIFWENASGKPLRTTTADANGNILQVINIPKSAAPGPHNLIGVGQTSGQSFTTSVTADTSWGDFGFDVGHQRENPYEYSVGVNNVTNLQLKWKGTTQVSLKDSPVYANGMVYIGTMDGYLNAYDATTGALKWQFNSNSTFRNFSSPVVDPVTGMIFFGTVGYADEGIPSPFYAIDGQTGALVWSVILNWHQVSFPTIAFNTVYVGTSHLDHTGSSVYALDVMTGNIRWQHSDNSGFWGAVGVDTSTNTVFTGEGNPGAAVLAMNASTGQVIWSTPIAQYGADDDVGSAITVDSGYVYATSKNGSVYKLNESTGTIVWTTAIGSQSIGTISSQAVSANGMLYVGGINGYLYALNTSTGAVAWHIHAGSNIFSSPAIANGVVYFASFDKNIYAVNASNGTVLWKYTTGNISYSSPIFVNGWLYCGSTDGNLYAFSL